MGQIWGWHTRRRSLSLGKANGCLVILNFGSINIDNVYRVAHMPQPGETIAAKGFDRVLGGKGINQTVASARAGGQVFHVGHVGDDTWIMDQLSQVGVAVDYIDAGDAPTGHAIIYVDDDGENQIVIWAGANAAFDRTRVGTVLAKFADQSIWVVLQNEINLSVEIAQMAKAAGHKVCYSAAPFDADHARAILPYVDLLALNETELSDLSRALDQEISDLGVGMVLVTLGAKGAELHRGGQVTHQSSFAVTPVDTTGAGDTFLGSFIARFDAGDAAEVALEYAAAAAALQVTGTGAAQSIPDRLDVVAFIKDQSA